MKFMEWNIEVGLFGGQEGDNPHVALRESNMHYILLVVRTDKCPAKSKFATTVMNCRHESINPDWNAGTLENQFNKLNNPRETIVHGEKVKDLERYFAHQLGIGQNTRARGNQKTSPKGETIVVPIARISEWMKEAKVDAIILNIQQCLTSKFEKLPKSMDTTNWVNNLTNAIDEVQETYLAITPSKVS